MLILGKNTDDVGAQLEKLTKRLLENRGYKNIATDTIGEGGNEIDVQAENPSRIPSSHSSRRLIAECKAWATPINLPDWLKFLGKVFVEEAKVGNEVEGLFVSLSGVNGAVRGNYDSLRQRKSNVVLLESEQLTEEISKLYNLPQSAVIAAKLKHFTEQQYSSMELAYYSEHFYWVFMFPDRDIAVLNASGEPANMALLEEIRAMLIKRLDARCLIDLAAERLALERARDSIKFLLISLFNSGGELPLVFTDSEQGGFSVVELRAAFKHCESSGWASCVGDNYIALSFNAEEKTDKLIEALRFLVVGTLKVEDWSRLVGSKLFSELLNEHFFKQISFIQAGLVLDADFETKLRLLVKISPSALAHAIHPDPMIVTARINQPDVQKNEKEDRQRLMRSLLRSFRHDFNQSQLKQFIFQNCGLREIEVVEHYSVKDKDAVILKHEAKERSAIAQADKSLGGGLLYMEAFSCAPEPWDWMKPKPEAAGSEPPTAT